MGGEALEARSHFQFLSALLDDISTVSKRMHCLNEKVHFIVECNLFNEECPGNCTIILAYSLQPQKSRCN